MGPEPPDGDLDLVTRAKGGDVDAYAVLLRRHEADARRLAATLCGSGSADADEAAQDAFVKAWYGLGGFRDGAAFRPWLLRIVANEARNRRRARGRRAGYELRFAARQAAVEAVPSPESAALATEARRAVVSALARLPAGQRDVVVCRHLVGLSEAETAEVLGLPPGTVKSRTARGLRRLHDLLAGTEGEPDG
ncbi:MAG TPA: sigma-70 family RNA polymerase sigma factor [Acidimicrobiales bacterium]